MNFYKHHIGDYDQATRHLTFVEDAAFSRLIRKYYAEEKPFPTDAKRIEKLVGARTKDEKAAIQSVLEEFFYVDGNVWRNKRCDEEIVKANAQAEANRKVALAREASKRQRIEHESSTNRDSHNTTNRVKTGDESCDDLLENPSADDGEKATFLENKKIKVEEKSEVPTEQNATEPRPDSIPEHDSLKSRAPSQTPDTRHQTKDCKPSDLSGVVCTSSSETENNATCNPAIATKIAIKLRAAGIQGANGFNPHITRWAENPKVTDAMLDELLALVAQRKPGVKVSVGYLATIMPDLLNPAPIKAPKPKQDDWHRTDAGIDRKAAEMGMMGRPGQGYKELKDRIFDEIRRREINCKGVTK
jgi:uncharacterized protein YdaU (DUF1376 family)